MKLKGSGGWADNFNHCLIKESATEDQSAVRGLVAAESSALPVAPDASVQNEVLLNPTLIHII